MKLTEQIENEYGNVDSQEKKEINRDAINKKIVSVYKDWLTYLQTDTIVKQKGLLEMCPISSTIYSQQIENYSPQDITSLSIQLEQFQKENLFCYSGYFLTTLIMKDYQKTKRKEPYLIITENLDTSINHLCFQLNGPSVFIQGSTGKDTCERMHSGNVIITGNIGENSCNSMKGGIVTVQKDSENSLASHLKGGEIIIYGNVKNKISTQSCSSMKNGIITVKGNAQNIGHCMLGGKIIVEGNVTGHIGNVMYDGEIIIHGNAEHVGCGMRNGKIMVQGKIEMIGHNETFNINDKFCPRWGKIYEKDIQVFPQKNEGVYAFLKRLKMKIMDK